MCGPTRLIEREAYRDLLYRLPRLGNKVKIGYRLWRSRRRDTNKVRADALDPAQLGAKWETRHTGLNFTLNRCEIG